MSRKSKLHKAGKRTKGYGELSSRVAKNWERKAGMEVLDQRHSGLRGRVVYPVDRLIKRNNTVDLGSALALQL